MLPDSKPVMDSKVLMVCTRGITDVYSCFCFSSEKSPWTRPRRWCLLMLFVMIGMSLFIFYNSSPRVSWPVWMKFEMTRSWTSQSHYNVADGNVSIFTGLCHLERKATVMSKEKSTIYPFFFLLLLLTVSDSSNAIKCF